MTNVIRNSVLAFVIAVAAASSVLAAELKLLPLVKPKDLSVHVNQNNCASWTDECVNCSRGADGGAPVCSNIGFACQPQAIRCLENTQPTPKTK